MFCWSTTSRYWQTPVSPEISAISFSLPLGNFFAVLLSVEQPAQKSCQGNGWFQKTLYMEIITKSKVYKEGLGHLPFVSPCPSLMWMTNQTSDIDAFEAVTCPRHNKKGACMTLKVLPCQSMAMHVTGAYAKI